MVRETSKPHHTGKSSHPATKGMGVLSLHGKNYPSNMVSLFNYL